MTSPRTPVLVGCHQIVQRVDDPRDGVEPLELMARAIQGAGEDAGAPALVRQADSIRVPHGLWKYSNPAALLRERVGAPRAETGLGVISGHMVQRMINTAAVDISAGRRDVVIVTGGEAEHSQRRAGRAGQSLGWTVQEGSTPDDDFGGPGEFFMAPWEIERGLVVPAVTFSLFENALRAERGESLEDHRVRISELWARLSKVAASNPYAWSPTPLSAEEIRTPGPDNPWAAWPYTKYMCANLVVDMAAAVIVCSREAADRAGVPADRRVYLHAASDVEKTPFLSFRADLRSSPTLRAVGERALELAGAGIDDMTWIDAYSCFPVAVQLAYRELGIPPERDATVTGGLGFGGGPVNSYVLHAVAAMMDRVRETPGEPGFVGSVGGWFTKQAAAIYSTAPPEGGFRYASLDAEGFAPPTRECDCDKDPSGEVEIETYGLRFKNGEPKTAVFACLQDGRRSWANSQDPELLAALTREEFIGRRARVAEHELLDVR